MKVAVVVLLLLVVLDVVVVILLLLLVVVVLVVVLLLLLLVLLLGDGGDLLGDGGNLLGDGDDLHNRHHHNHDNHVFASICSSSHHRERLNSNRPRCFRPPDRHHHHRGELRGIFENLKCLNVSMSQMSSVTINCQVTKIVMNSGSQLSEL